MHVKRLLLVIVVATLGAAVYTYAPAAQKAGAPAAAAIGSQAPDFTLKDAYGKEFKLSDFKDKIVVLEWINQHCPVSHGTHQKRLMQDTYKKYAGKGVIWLAIDTTAGAQPEKNRVYAADQGIAYPILHDTDGKVGHSYGAKRTPHMFVIDKAGKLAYTGAIDDHKDKNYVSIALDELLAGKSVSNPETEPYGCGVKYP
jgi:peroxiredoxin